MLENVMFNTTGSKMLPWMWLMWEFGSNIDGLEYTVYL